MDETSAVTGDSCATEVVVLTIDSETAHAAAGIRPRKRRCVRTVKPTEGIPLTALNFGHATAQTKPGQRWPECGFLNDHGCELAGICPHLKLDHNTNSPRSRHGAECGNELNSWRASPHARTDQELRPGHEPRYRLASFNCVTCALEETAFSPRADMETIGHFKRLAHILYQYSHWSRRIT